MKIQIEQLQEGCILLKDILSATNKPLAYKKTIITEHIIEVLKAFLINEVEVESTLKNGEKFQPFNIVEDTREAERHLDTLDEKPFYQQYLETIKKFKQLFLGWQAGTPVDIGKIRNVILPLVSEMESNEDEVIKLYHYCKQEDYIFHHSVSVSLVSAYLARKLNYNQGDVNQIALTGLLCDCGMAKIDPKILTKKVTLTEREYRDIKQHPVHSYHLLKNIVSIKEGVKIGVLQHHERIDSSGYPLAVKGEQLHPYSKIVALADTYQAMVTVRPYRSKQSPFKVLEQIIQDDFGKFEINIVNKLKDALIKFSIDTKVRLSNGLIAQIIFIDELYPTRPIIKVTKTGEIIALKDKRELFIEEII